MNVLLKMLLIVSALVLVVSKVAVSQPMITSIDKSRLAEGLVTITGSNFGGAPNVELHDDFEHTGAVTGETVALNKAIVGDWYQKYEAYTPLYDDFAMSGKHSMLAWNNEIPYMRTLEHTFTTPIQSFYMSYWVAIPDGFPFPGYDNDVGGFSSDSSWKLTWIFDESRKGLDSDLCIPTYIGGGQSLIAGNDWNLAHPADITEWWSWGKWIRITAWLHASPDAPTVSGNLRFSTWSKEHGQYLLEKDTPVFDNDGPATKQYKAITFPGWIRNFTDGIGRPLYDDVYVASGNNAYARVELSDSTDYYSSSEFAIQHIESWSDTQIIFRVVNGGLTDAINAKIHLFTGDGNSLSEGSPPAAPELKLGL